MESMNANSIIINGYIKENIEGGDVIAITTNLFRSTDEIIHLKILRPEAVVSADVLNMFNSIYNVDINIDYIIADSENIASIGENFSRFIYNMNDLFGENIKININIFMEYFFSEDLSFKEGNIIDEEINEFYEDSYSIIVPVQIYKRNGAAKFHLGAVFFEKLRGKKTPPIFFEIINCDDGPLIGGLCVQER